MAKIQVTGKVQKHLGDKGFVLAEAVRKQVDGVWETIATRYFTVWFPEQPAVGLDVEVQGSFSAKLDEYQGKPQLKQTINANQVVPVTPKAVAHQLGLDTPKSAPTAPASVLSANEELPF